MSDKTELARQYHERGFNCAQSVLAPFAPEYGLSEDVALRISTGFGSGHGPPVRGLRGPDGRLHGGWPEVRSR